MNRLWSFVEDHPVPFIVWIGLTMVFSLAFQIVGFNTPTVDMAPILRAPRVVEHAESFRVRVSGGERYFELLDVDGRVVVAYRLCEERP